MYEHKGLSHPTALIMNDFLNGFKTDKEFFNRIFDSEYFVKPYVFLMVEMFNETL